MSKINYLTTYKQIVVVVRAAAQAMQLDYDVLVPLENQ